MKRRSFLKSAGTAVTLPLALNGLRFTLLAQTPQTEQLLRASIGSDKALVIIQLEGGNDGLNTVIPVEDSNYYTFRPTIGIAKDAGLPLEGNPLLRLHPAMSGMQRMFNDGEMAILGNVGYERNSFSHFEGTENWNTASIADFSQRLQTGWVGRFLVEEFPGYPQVLPQDPPAVQISAAVSSIFSSSNGSMAISLTDPAEFYALVNGGPASDDEQGPDTKSGREFNYVALIGSQALDYSESIRRAAEKATNKATYPAESALAASLAIIARLIAGGLQTRVYLVKLGGFDTHANQLARQAALLQELSEAIAAFIQDAQQLGIADRVVGMTYSEFGRRVRENGGGTDHGTASAHFVFGKLVAGGAIHGGPPNLDDLAGGTNLKHAINFPCYYASVIGPLFNIPPSSLGTIFPLGLCDTLLPLYNQQPTGVQDLPDQETPERMDLQ
ncbi:MAG: DUF1501 domain-containing protein [Chlorobi bacterium]|nr:MAG: hypothetical protein UZ07_CHB004003390 [Chlorobi bacterium OLB7]MBK8912395.1 DUF1501 domain-containing protein [Chlorobiota bacterium]MBX7217753.1 DUF1501 domain-containing protein [Candidatus Kapabacteria bacterium]